MNSAHGNEDAFSLADLWRILFSKLWMILLITGVALAAAATWTAISPRWYAASVTIRVEKPVGEIQMFTPQEQEYYDRYFVAEQFEIIKSRGILRQVVEELALVEVFSELTGAQFTLENTLAYLGSNTSVEEKQGTSVLEITVETPEPELSASIANALARIYEEDRKAFAESGPRRAVASLEERLAAQEARVDALRDRVEELRRENNITGRDLRVSTQPIEIQRVQQLESQLIDARIQRISRKTLWESIRGIPDDQMLQMVNSETIRDPNITQLLQQYIAAEREFGRLSERLGSKHPEMIAVRQNRDQIRSQLIALLEGYERSLKMAFDEADALVRELEQQLADVRAQEILTASTDIREFQEAVQELENAERVLDSLEVNLRTREIDLSVPRRSVEILSQAVAPRPSEPSRPNWLLNLGLAAVLGLIAGTSLAFLVEAFDTSFRSVDSIENRLGYPILGVVPRKAVLVNKKSFHGQDFEPYRVINANLALADSGQGGNGASNTSGNPRRKVVVFQSSGPGEGKSTTLHNVAAIMALSGEKILVVDSDLRRPGQHDLLGLKRQPGLSDYLAGEASPEQILQQSAIDNLDFIASGRPSRMTLSVLNARKLMDLLRELASRYDRILLDSPPVIGVSDASVLASRADGVVLVLQHRRNPASMNLRARTILRNVDAHVLGVVLNQVPGGGDEDYSYYTANYGAYGDLPSEEPESPRRQETVRVDESRV